MPSGITIVLSLYSKIKPILADFVRIPSNFRIRMKIPPRRRMHPSIVQVDPTPPGHPAEAREFVRVPATSCGRCRASLGGPAGFSSQPAATAEEMRIGSKTQPAREPATPPAPSCHIWLAGWPAWQPPLSPHITGEQLVPKNRSLPRPSAA